MFPSFSETMMKLKLINDSLNDTVTSVHVITGTKLSQFQAMRKNTHMQMPNLNRKPGNPTDPPPKSQ